jgi:hypothetical protein
MCVDCNPLESNTGVIHYSGPDLELCNGVSITNGELLTSVIAKFDNCIGALQNQLDITGLIENSPCIDLVQTSLKTVLQSILDAQSDFCTQLQALNTQITNLQNQVNNLEGNKVISITACDPSRVQVTSDTSTQKSFKINGLVPPKTILPYFGLPTDFGPTGLGLSNGPVAGWAIANGQSHTIGGVTYTTINALNNFIKYGPSAITTPSGNNSVTLGAQNIPPVSFTTNANFTVTGTTNEAGNHKHRMIFNDADEDNFCGNCTDGIPFGNDDFCGGNAGIDQEGLASGACHTSSKLIGSSGLHSHTFTGNGTGSFTGSTINSSVQSINTQPVHIQAIPIQFVGC